MKLKESIYLFASNIVWRTTGVRPAGRILINTLSSQDQDLKTIAGMFLVQSGSKAEPLLQEALDKRQSLPMIMTILADIGEPEFEPVLHRYSQDDDPEVAQAARDALAVLARKHGS